MYKLKDPSGRLVRWMNMLQEFDFELKHNNMVADFLSRPLFFIRGEYEDVSFTDTEVFGR